MVEADNGAAFVCGKRQLFVVGQAQIPGVACGQAINPMRMKQRGSCQMNVFIEIEFHCAHCAEGTRLELRDGVGFRRRKMFGNFAVNVFSMVVVVGQRIIDRGKIEVRILNKKFLGAHSVVEGIDDDGSNRNACSIDSWATATDLGITGDVWVQDIRHARSLSDWSGVG